MLDASLNLKTDTIKPTDIIYVNQQKLAASSYSFTFSLPENIAFGTYAVYVGCDGVDTPAVKYFTIPSNVITISYVSGDFDKDGKADLVDAIHILRCIKSSVSVQSLSLIHI